MLNPDSEAVYWIRFAFASATVLALMAGLAFGLRAVVSRGWFIPKGQGQRLKLISTLTLDTRRRLVLVKCDKTEHLLLIGSDGNLHLSAAPAPLDPKDTNP